LGGDEDSSSDSEPAFEFDNYDIDEHRPPSHSPSLNIPPKHNWSYSSSTTTSPTSPVSYTRPYPHIPPSAVVLSFGLHTGSSQPEAETHTFHISMGQDKRDTPELEQ